jgi:mono/diheme cytochrome c family protein
MTRPRILLALLALAVVAGAVAWFIRGPGPLDFAGGPTVTLADYKGANPTGVPASLSHDSLIERGAYLAHAADCMACHSKPGGADFAGGLGFKLPFGTLYSTNITPDKENGIGNYSDAEFIKAVRKGIRRDGAMLYPAMPYTSYSYLTDEDTLAIKAYLFSLPAAHQRPPANSLAFPFNQRWAMWFWATMFNRDTRFAPDTSKSPEWNRGAYLAEALAHCGECHTPRNLAFAVDNREKFAGALTAGWHAFNITSDKTSGVGGWSDADLASYLADGHASGHGTASGPMGEAVDRSFSWLTSDDIQSLVAYLRTVPAIASNEAAVASIPASASHKSGGGANPRGKLVFEGACVSCHGWSGQSPISPMATLTGAAAVSDISGTNVVQIVLSGTRRLTPEGALSMPAFGDAYSDDEIAAVANYVAGRFGAQGGAKATQVTPKDVAKLREEASE